MTCGGYTVTRFMFYSLHGFWGCYTGCVTVLFQIFGDHYM